MADQPDHYTHQHARYTHNADGSISKSMVNDRESYTAKAVPGMLGGGMASAAASALGAEPKTAMQKADEMSGE